MDIIQQRALETWYDIDHPLHWRFLPALLGLAGETGELVDLHKKHLFKSSARISREQYLDELGDVLFYVAILAHQLGVTLDKLSQKNHAKLRAREQNGTGYNRGE